MDASVIDTLRYASRLKAAGVEPQQAEAMSRALNDEIGSGVATKGDLEHAVDGLTGEIARVERELKEEIGRLEGDLKTSIATVDGRINNLDTKVEGLAAKFDAQGRYVFLVLALIAAFGLYNVMFPPLATRFSQTADVQVAAPAPVEATGPLEQQPSVQP